MNTRWKEPAVASSVKVSTWAGDTKVPNRAESEAAASALLQAGRARADDPRRVSGRGDGQGIPRPLEILFEPGLPRTRALKVMRGVVKALQHGAPGDMSSLANPEALPAITALRNAIGD